MTYSSEESEAINLCIAWEAIDNMVNRTIFDLGTVDTDPEGVTVLFHSMIHRDLFLVRLLDFSREAGGPSLTGEKGSCLAVLQKACKTLSFNVEGSSTALIESIESMAAWLQAETTMTLWLPTLDVNTKLSVPRIQFLFIAGNQAKHNVSRLTAVSNYITTLLVKHGYEVAPKQIPLALDDIQEHLQSDYFIYYGSWLAELLNNVRWGIYQYLLPTFYSSFTPDPKGGIAYTYKYPETICNQYAKEWFWRLMNLCRRGPYVRPFSVAAYMKKEILR